MFSLRFLAFSYLAAAFLFLVGWALMTHPELGQGARALATMARDDVLNPALDQLRAHDLALLDSQDRTPSAQLAIAPLAPGAERLLPRRDHAAAPTPRTVAAADDRLTQPEYAASANVTILPDLSPEAAPVPPEPTMIEPHLATPHTPKVPAPDFDIARDMPPLPPVTTPVSIAARHLNASLTADMRANFDLFIFVSKAQRGPLAQRMYVFAKTGDGLQLLHDWPVSTGREQSEISPRGRSSFTSTPAGFYQFDPDRMYRRYRSYSWMQDMPFAMFFNWERQGVKTGLAIHSAVGDDIAKLGSRASAGCVHLSPENARTLFDLVKDKYQGRVPRFAYTEDTDTMSNRGGFAHRRDGSLKMADGYRVLIDIDDYAGRDVLARN